MTLRFLFSAILLFSAANVRANSNDWYGTITFSKTSVETFTESYPEGHPYHPGSRLRTTRKTWAGVSRYLPGPKQVVTATYISKKQDDRRTDRVGPCHWADEPKASHDYETTQVDTTVTVNQAWNLRLNFRIKPDGTYKSVAPVPGGDQLPDATRYYQRREWFSECARPHLTVNEDEHFSADGMQNLRFEHIEGTADVNAPAISGTWSGRDNDGGELTYSWNLTRAEPRIVARITATPSTVHRGETVTLRAAESTGRITRYEWDFSPIGECLFPQQGATAKMEGTEISFQALCDLNVSVRVSNEAEFDTASFPLMIKARRGTDWRTRFQTRAGPNFSSPIVADYLHFGMNRCAVHGAQDGSDIWIHTDAENSRTWRDAGYTIAQVQDQGPFQGAWFVESQQLRVDRLERINGALLVGGEIYALNQRRNNLGDLNALVAQIRAHEAAHSSLVNERLRQLGPDGDPAARIEKLVGVLDEEDFQFKVDFEVRQAETLFQEASSEDQVKQRLRASFAREASIWVPTRAGDEFLKALGPLWSVGH